MSFSSNSSLNSFTLDTLYHQDKIISKEELELFTVLGLTKNDFDVEKNYGHAHVLEKYIKLELEKIHPNCELPETFDKTRLREILDNIELLSKPPNQTFTDIVTPEQPGGFNFDLQNISDRFHTQKDSFCFRFFNLNNDEINIGQYEEFIYSEFEIYSKLGEGAEGQVYRAKYRGRDVALKLIQDIDIFNKELKIYQKVTQLSKTFPEYVKNSIIQLIGFTEKNGYPILVMEYEEGMTLKNFLNQYMNLSIEEIIAKLIKISQIMKFLHENGIVHSDLHENNIFIPSLNPHIVKILDFGRSKERSFSENISPEIDIFRFGEIGKRMIANRKYGLANRQVQSLALLLEKCSDPQRNLRPNFAQVEETLTSIQREIQTPSITQGNYFIWSILFFLFSAFILFSLYFVLTLNESYDDLFQIFFLCNWILNILINIIPTIGNVVQLKRKGYLSFIFLNPQFVLFCLATARCIFRIVLIYQCVLDKDDISMESNVSFLQCFAGLVNYLLLISTSKLPRNLLSCGTNYSLAIFGFNSFHVLISLLLKSWDENTFQFSNIIYRVLAGFDIVYCFLCIFYSCQFIIFERVDIDYFRIRGGKLFSSIDFFSWDSLGFVLGVLILPGLQIFPIYKLSQSEYLYKEEDLYIWFLFSEIIILFMSVLISWKLPKFEIIFQQKMKILEILLVLLLPSAIFIKIYEGIKHKDNFKLIMTFLLMGYGAVVQTFCLCISMRTLNRSDLSNLFPWYSIACFVSLALFNWIWFIQNTLMEFSGGNGVFLSGISCLSVFRFLSGYSAFILLYNILLSRTKGTKRELTVKNIIKNEERKPLLEQEIKNNYKLPINYFY